MSDELRRAVLAIQDMEKAISRIESRLDRVEKVIFEHDASAVFEPRRTALPADIVADREPAHSPFAINSVLIGRSLIVFGGAYLLRALTESGAFPIMIGAMAGLLYAAIFLFLAFRQAGTRRVSATFHGMMASLIAMPLAVETAVGFHEMRPAVSFLIILTYGALSGATAVSNRLKALTWIVQAITVGSLIALTVGSHNFVLGLLAFLALSVGSLMADRELSVPPLILMPAVFSTLLVLPIADLSVTPDTPPGPVIGLIAILSFVTVWVVSLMLDSWTHDDRPGPGLLMHLFVVVLIGGGAGIYVSQRTGLAFLFSPILALIALATGFYAWRMTVRAGDRDTRSVTFVLVTTILVMAVTGSILGTSATALTWLVLAALSILPARTGHPLLYAPSTVLILGAAFESGLIEWVSRAMLVVPDPSSLFPSVSALTTLAASAAVLTALSDRNVKRGFFRSSIDATTTTILAGGCAGFAIHVLQLGLPAIGVAIDDPGAVAAVRTIVLSIAAIALAWIARVPRSRTTGVLVNPVLILTAVLIVAVNVRVGRAATHFPAFIVYGLALIIAPTLKRRSLAIRRERDDTLAAGEPEPATDETVGTV